MGCILRTNKWMIYYMRNFVLLKGYEWWIYIPWKPNPWPFTSCASQSWMFHKYTNTTHRILCKIYSKQLNCFTVYMWLHPSDPQTKVEKWNDNKVKLHECLVRDDLVSHLIMKINLKVSSVNIFIDPMLHSCVSLLGVIAVQRQMEMDSFGGYIHLS